jgi:hypothetical protein
MKNIVLFILLMVTTQGSIAAGNSSPTPILCPDIDTLNAQADGTITPPDGWQLAPVEYRNVWPSSIPAEYLKTWKKDVNSINYNQPSELVWGVNLACQYSTNYSSGYGLFVLFKIAPDGFADNLWDASAPHTVMSNCWDTNPHGSGACYWSTEEKQPPVSTRLVIPLSRTL